MPASPSAAGGGGNKTNKSKKSKKQQQEEKEKKKENSGGGGVLRFLDNLVTAYEHFGVSTDTPLLSLVVTGIKKFGWPGTLGGVGFGAWKLCSYLETGGFFSKFLAYRTTNNIVSKVHDLCLRMPVKISKAMKPVLDMLEIFGIMYCCYLMSFSFHSVSQRISHSSSSSSDDTDSDEEEEEEEEDSRYYNNQLRRRRRRHHHHRYRHPSALYLQNIVLAGVCGGLLYIFYHRHLARLSAASSTTHLIKQGFQAEDIRLPDAPQLHQVLAYRNPNDGHEESVKILTANNQDWAQSLFGKTAWEGDSYDLFSGKAAVMRGCHGPHLAAKDSWATRLYITVGNKQCGEYKLPNNSPPINVSKMIPVVEEMTSPGGKCYDFTGRLPK